MKKLIFPFLLAALTAFEGKAVEPSDTTTRVFENPASVSVTNADGVTTVRVRDAAATYTYTSDTQGAQVSPAQTGSNTGSNVDVTLPFEKNKKWHKVRMPVLANIFGGWVHPVDGEPWLKNGWEIGIGQAVGVDWQPWRLGPTFSTGLGFSWRFLLAQNDTYYCKVGEVVVGLPYAENQVRDYSRLKLFNFQVPLLVNQNIYRDFGIQLGAIMNFNTYATATTQMLVDGVQTHVCYKGLHQRFVTFDLFAAIGFMDDCGIYVRYSPMQPFEDGMGPRMHTLAVGAMIGF